MSFSAQAPALPTTSNAPATRMLRLPGVPRTFWMADRSIHDSKLKIIPYSILFPADCAPLEFPISLFRCNVGRQDPDHVAQTYLPKRPSERTGSPRNPAHDFRG